MYRPERPDSDIYAQPENHELRLAIDAAQAAEQIPRVEPVSELASNIKDTKSFRQLFEVLDTVAGIRGSDQFYDTEYLKETIAAVQAGQDISTVTRAQGLRDKVAELLIREKIEDTNDFGLEWDVKTSSNITQLIDRVSRMRPFTYEGITYDPVMLAQDIDTFWNAEEHNVEIPNVFGLYDKIMELHSIELKRIHEERQRQLEERQKAKSGWTKFRAWFNVFGHKK
jgi:hypothetical protein